ncbi:hypothetical protein R5R35_008181 [Gryllus longicercus]|uniref:3-hydroxyacyl-CoA dehydrogenase n=1 Tax=Gryllus longicercus TaxID=2509291 RepID=A0AAN9VWJ7_9ORTH
MALPVTVLARGFASSAAAAAAIKHVTIVGGGLMGSGIAQVSAQHGNQVTLVDVSEDVLKKSRQNIETSLKRVAKKMFKDDTAKGEQLISETLSRIQTNVDLKSAVQKADLVLEAVVEKIEVKHELFSLIDNVAPESTIFASNTSSLLIGDIASVSTRKDRFAGLHFFNPVPVMKLLEVVRIPETSDDTYNKLIEWGAAIGKTTVTCKDTPGFIVNRLLIPYSSEAIRMLERGDATARDIDTAMKLGAGYPMGPIELADYTGLDTGHYIRQAWAKKFPGNPLFEPSKLVEKLVSEGKLGRKTGEGFYKY